MTLIPEKTVSAAASQKPKLNIRKLEITLGDTFRLRIYNMKKKYKATFTSSNTDVVSVKNVKSAGKSAVLSANAIGSATITVVVKKGKRTIRQLKCKAKVSPNAVSIKFTHRVIRLHPFDQTQLDTIIKPATSTEQPVFESEDTEVATISSFGIVTANSPGITTITATLLSTNQTATCIVVVEEEDSETDAPAPGQNPVTKQIETKELPE